jgi:hypothetical protein
MKPKYPKPIEQCYKLFGARVALLRVTPVGYVTQEELAQRIGLSRTSIVNIENGNQRVLLYDVQRFAKALGVTTRTLLKGVLE